MLSKMEAVQFNAATKKVELIQKSLPDQIGDNQILIQVHFAGVCGTDLHIIAGEYPCKEDGPIVLGHEFSGVVAKIGKNIRHVKVGDKVVTDPNQGCLVCSKCRYGNTHYCKDGGLNNTIGIFSDGGWAQYCLVPDLQVHKIPDTISLQQAALCEPVSCISHAWDRISPVNIGKRILIVGSGIIGNLFTCLLHLKGHKNVTISEPNEKRLKMVEKLGTGFELLTPEVLKQRFDNDDSYLFDVVIDCSGNAKAIEQAFSMLDSGGKLCIFGVSNPTAKMSISPYVIFKKELSIIGVAINPFSFPKALGFLESLGNRYLDYEKLGIELFSLNEYQKAIDSLKEGRIAKATFKIKQ